MINTLMALWNRGWKGRCSVVILVFIGLCISTSLLVITAGGAWGALFVQRSNAGLSTRTVYAVYRSPTGPALQVTVTATATQVTIPSSCLASSTAGAQATRATPRGGPAGRPRKSPTPAHSYPQHTPTPVITKTPVRRPSPTPTRPALTPTPVVTSTPGATPTSVPSPSITPTPSPEPVPTITPTPGITPTKTPPIITPTGSVHPTVTAPTGPQPTETPTLLSTPGGHPPTATVPHGTPGVQSIGGSSLPAGTSQQAGTGEPYTSNGAAGNCLGSSLFIGGASMLLFSLQLEFWVIFSTSLTGTVIFCGMIARLSKRKSIRANP